MSSPLGRSILKTVIYADIFDYPLTQEEIRKWLIEFRINPPAGEAGNLELRIKKLKKIKEKTGYYFLKGREKIVDLRRERQKFSKEKLKIAKEIVDFIKLIPYVKLVGITGALAMNNAKETDDIDLFIVTSSNLLWTVRFLATILAEVTGTRRHPGDNSVNNKICLNMFADENYLAVPPKERDLFSAHEVLQMKPLFDRDNTYQKFLAANKWVKKYLPNALKINNKEPASPAGRQKTNNKKSKNLLINSMEKLTKRFQLWYMKNRRTTEVIKDGIIRFHPQDAREWVMRDYKNKCKLLAAI